MLSFILYLFIGVISWTLLEYVLHRFVGHWKKGKNEFTAEHLRHHRETHYFAPAYKKAMLAIVVLGILTTILGLVFSWLEGFAFALGLTGMYLIYEMIHWRAHKKAPIGQYGRWVRKHHFYHHFKNPKMNHGVTSPVWDIIFGTNVNPEILLVPRKLALPWLVDNSGEILSEFQKDYRLRGGSTAKV